MLAGNIESMRQSIKSMTDSLEKSRDEAQKRESYIHLILKNSNDIIQINDAQGNILFASQSLTRILGYPLSELQYKSALEFIHPDDRDLIINDLDMIVNNPGKSIQEEYRYRHKKGHWVHLEAIACNLFHEPAIQGILLNIRDITKRKNAEEEHQRMRDTIHHSQKMEAVGKLAGGIAHDFNNAISGIMSAVELIAIEETTPEEIREYSDLILTSAQNAGDLTKKLLTFTRKRTTAHAPLEIEQVLNDTSNILHHTVDKSIHISSPKTTDKACIMGDSAVIQNALINLGINGAHAMPQGGTLTFTVENMYLDREYCSHSPFDISPGDYVRISVADTGCGMSPEVTARIFEPFFTTKKEGEGTGLGLAAVYGTVQEHRGAITVYSEEGAGTVFHLYFPRTKQCSTGKNEAEIPYRGEGTILLIDDEEIIRKTGAGILKTMGYTVFTAKNGHKGVELFSAKQSEIDLVILDMIMPVMGGNRAFELLRVRNPHIPIIICSGFSKEDDFKRMQTQGKVMFLSKPFRKKELARAVFEILGAHRTE
jgi:PAS domain S-box-containing protein